MSSSSPGSSSGPAAVIFGAVLACPDVSALSRGPFGTVATYLPGGQVPGVAVRDDEVEVHVVARYGRPVPEIADAVRAAVVPHAGGRAVTVVVDDLDVSVAADT